MNIFHSTNPVNILFLDIDEVLNCNFNKEQDDLHKHVMFCGKITHDRFNPALVANMNRLIERYDLKIVLSSTWRKLFDMITMREILTDQFGLKGDLLDYTTRYHLDLGYKERLEWEGVSAIHHERGLQISQWLSERKYNVANYIVIDDGIDASYGHEFNFHQTFSTRGFDDASYEECIVKFDKIFNK